MEYRLNDVPADRQAQWGQLELLAWRTIREAGNFVNDDGYVSWTVDVLGKQGHIFPRDYLEHRLDKGDILAMALIGRQKEEWAIEGLKKYATLKGSTGDYARGALAHIGTYAALRALEDSLVPGGDKTVNDHITGLLGLYGDRASTELMGKLALDQRYSERERQSFEITRQIIEKRLSAQ